MLRRVNRDHAWAIACDETGAVVEILNDSKKFFGDYESFPDIAAMMQDRFRTTYSKFVGEILEQGHSMRNELVLLKDGQEFAFSLIGIAKHGRIFLLALQSPQQIFLIFDEFMAMINEQARELREIQKKAKQCARGRMSASDHDLLEGYVSLNTELAKMQRELSIKNQALQSQEKRFRDLVTLNPDAQILLSASNQILFFNPAAESILGLSSDESIGAVFPLTLSQESEFCLRSEQERIWVEVRQTSITWENAPATLVSLRDITERKQAEKKLRFLSAIAENMSDSIVTTDTDFTITYINKTAETLYGYTIEELRGYKSGIFNAEPLAKAIQRDIKATLSSGRRYQGESLNRRKDGSTFVCEYKIFPLIDEDGQAYAYVGIQRDITSRKQAEQALLKTNRELEEANARANDMAVEATIASRAKSEFLANMSHEIRTPINGVIGMTGLLLDTDLTEDQRRYAEIVKSSGESLLGLINDILDLSKIEAGKLDLETLDFELHSLLDDFAATMSIKTHSKGLELLCAADPDVPALLMGDPGRLRQILTNLTGNAVKFTHQGEVAVRVERVQESEREDSCLLRFSVRDTGIGIPADKIGVLFSKFTQVDASTTRQYGGTGLGLSISKQLAELMGGEIGVESVPGQGSEFWFTARFGVREGTAQEETAPVDLAGIRTLIVDDNATNREILTTRLNSWGMRPEEALDGPSGLQALYRALGENDPFLLAIIDMQMPGMDGEAVGRAVKADTRLLDTRLIMLTSLGTRGDAHRLQKIGFSAYATKPIQHQVLKTMLSQALSNSPDDLSHPFATRHTAREVLPRFTDRKARILLAEDNITNQQVALGILKKLGLKADAVANGREVIDALKTLPYDLVLMDVQMPEMDGMEATRFIRNPLSAIPNRRIPIIAMTARAMYGDKDKCLSVGMNDYVAKPVSIQALAQALEKWLPTADTNGMLKKPRVSRQKTEDDCQSSSTIFDRADLLERLMGDEDMADTILQGFLEDIPRQIEALRNYLEAGDATGAERQAHTIRGAAANVSGEALRELACELEKAGKSGDLESMKARLEDLSLTFAQLKQAMEENTPAAS